MKVRKVNCYCGQEMNEHEFVDGKWVAIQFCSQECKDKYSHFSNKSMINKDLLLD